MRFDWQNSKDEIRGLRSHATKDFLHPTKLGKRVRIQSGGLLHAFTNKGFEDIEKELPNYSFPEGKELKTQTDRHFVMDLPDWGEARVEDKGKVVRVFDKKGVSIFRYSNPIVVEKGKPPFKIVKDGKKVRDAFNAREGLGIDESIVNNEAVDEAVYEVENRKLYFKLPSVLKNSYPLQAYDATDTSSTNNKDTHISSYSGYQTYNYGALTTLQLYAASNQIKRLLMEWTLSADPGGVSISEISLFLKVQGSGGGTPQVDIHELTQAFVEGTGEGTATGDGATWLTYDGTNTWTANGGDYDATIVDSALPGGAGSWAEWVLRGAGATNSMDALTWGNTKDFLLKYNDEPSYPDHRYFHSKEAASGGDRPYIEITYFVSQTVSPSAIASLEAFGSSKVNLTMFPSAIVSSEAFGTSKLTLYLKPSSIVTEEAFGTLNLMFDQTLNLVGYAIPTEEAFGVAIVDVGKQWLYPDGIVSAEAFGTSKLNLLLNLTSSGIASQEDFGTPKLILTLKPSAITSLEAFGTPKLILYLLPSGIVSAEAFGTAVVAGPIIVSGIDSEEAFGTPQLNLTLFPSGIVSAEAFGLINMAAEQFLLPDGIVSGEAFGTAELKFLYTIIADGIPSAESFGTAKLNLYVVCAGIASSEIFGTPRLVLYLIPVGITSEEAFGTLQINQMGRILFVRAITTQYRSIKVISTGG